MDVLEIVGRVLFSLIFLVSALGHFKNTEAMAGYAQFRGVPAPKLSVQVSGLALLVGGVLVIAGGSYAAIGALVLFAFLVPTALLMHPFWKETDATAKMTEQIGFLKDLALAGAALVIYTFLK